MILPERLLKYTFCLMEVSPLNGFNLFKIEDDIKMLKVNSSYLYTLTPQVILDPSLQT